MFQANAETGQVIRKIVSTAADPHFDSLQFISSAGAWHPEGFQFVFAAIKAGQPVRTVIDSASGETRREITLREVDEIFNPRGRPTGA